MKKSAFFGCKKNACFSFADEYNESVPKPLEE
jgi:hypothetical protein